MQRFFVLPETLAWDFFRTREKSFCHQITRVLNLAPGAEILVLNNTGTEFRIQLTEVTRKKVVGKILEQSQNSTEPQLQLTLFQALPKKISKFEQLLRSATEVGVTEFRPLLTERTEVKGLARPERLERILREAAEQSGRGLIPRLTAVQKFSAILETPGFKLLADSFCLQPLLPKFLPQIARQKQVGILLGPEGGFSEREVQAAQVAGIPNFSLGPRVLRVETAGVGIASRILFN